MTAVPSASVVVYDPSFKDHERLVLAGSFRARLEASLPAETGE